MTIEIPDTFPERMRKSLRRYLVQHVRPGHFLMAVLTNNLHRAVTMADTDNLPLLRDYILFLYNEVTGECWGSPEKVEAWLNKKDQ